MNVINRLVLLILALLLIAVPVLALLMIFKLFSVQPDLVNSYTSYRAGLDTLGNFLTSGFSFGTRTRIIIGVVSALVALVAFVLLLIELIPRPRRARNPLVEREPGKETTLTTRAVTTIVESAALEAGASSPEVSLATVKGSSRVRCRIWAPGSSSFTDLAASTRENIRAALERCSVSYRDVEVTVQGVAAGSRTSEPVSQS